MSLPPFLGTAWAMFKAHHIALLGLFVGVLLPLLVFGKLSDEIHGQGGLWWDVATLRFIHRYASARLDSLIVAVTVLGGILAVPAIICMALLLRFVVCQPLAALFFAVSITGAWGLDIIAKLVFQRVRPSLWASPLPEGDYSFPSGHAMASMAIAAALVLLAWPTRLRWPALLGAIPCVIGVGLTRLYLGVHYPSDILAGWCAAAVWVVGSYWILWHKQAIALQANRVVDAAQSHS